MVGQGCPSAAVPRPGTASLPAAIAPFAAAKNPGPLQSANWPNGEPGRPSTQPRRSPSRVSVVPLKPNQTPTTAPAGSAGGAGAAAGLVPLSTTSGW